MDAFFGCSFSQIRPTFCFSIDYLQKTGDKKTCHCFKVIFDVNLIDESLMLIDRPIYCDFECMSRINIYFKTK